jgi:2-dehydropantoate 2-reductase
MRSKGVRISMPDEEMRQPVRAYHLCEVCSLNQQWDIVLLTAKSYDTCWMTEFIKPYLKPDGARFRTVSMISGLRPSSASQDMAVVELRRGLPRMFSAAPSKGTWFGLGELHGE